MHASEQNWGFSDACRNTTHLDPYTNCQSILPCAKAGEEPTRWKGGRRNLMLAYIIYQTLLPSASFNMRGLF